MKSLPAEQWLLMLGTLLGVTIFLLSGGEPSLDICVPHCCCNRPWITLWYPVLVSWVGFDVGDTTCGAYRREVIIAGCSCLSLLFLGGKMTCNIWFSSLQTADRYSYCSDPNGWCVGRLGTSVVPRYIGGTALAHPVAEVVCMDTCCSITTQTQMNCSRCLAMV